MRWRQREYRCILANQTGRSGMYLILALFPIYRNSHTGLGKNMMENEYENTTKTVKCGKGWILIFLEIYAFILYGLILFIKKLCE